MDKKGNTLRDIAIDLRVPEKIANNEFFGNAFKGFVADICRFSHEGSPLKDLFAKYRFDIKPYNDFNPNESMLTPHDKGLLLDTIKRYMNLISFDEAKQWLAENEKPDEVRRKTAMCIKEGRVLFQEVETVGKGVDNRIPGKNLKSSTFEVKENGNLRELNTQYYPDTGKTQGCTETIRDSKGVIISKKGQEYYEENGNISIANEYDPTDLERPAKTEHYYPNGEMKCLMNRTHLENGNLLMQMKRYTEKGIQSETSSTEVTRDGKKVSSSIVSLDENGYPTETKIINYDENGNEIIPDKSADQTIGDTEVADV